MLQTLEYKQAVDSRLDMWVRANGGSEEVTLARDGNRYVYVYNPYLDLHGWICVDTDIVQLDSPYFP